MYKREELFMRKKGIVFLAIIMVYAIGSLWFSVSAYTVDITYSVASSRTYPSSVSLKYDNSYRMDTTSIFNKGNLLSADQVQSTLSFSGNGSYTNAGRTVKWVGANGTTKNGNYNGSSVSTYPTTTVVGDLWVSTLNTYHNYQAKSTSGGPSGITYLVGIGS